MVTIHKSFPFKNFARWVWEFKEDVLFVSMRSLTAESNWEVPYRDIKRIHHQRGVDFSSINLATTLLAIVGFGLLINDIWHFVNPTILLVAKILIVLALLLWIPGFMKHEYYVFSDKENSSLVTLKINWRNRALVEEAVQLVKNKRKITENSYTEPLPLKKALFEIEDLDPFYYFTRRKIFFFPNNILQYTQSLVSDSFTTLEYSQLNGKVTSARLGDNSWDYIWCYWLYFVTTIGLAIVLLFPRFLYHNWYFIWALIGAYALLIPVYISKFIKRETWILLDKHGERLVYITVTPTNQERLEKIGVFIAKKVQPKKRKPA